MEHVENDKNDTDKSGSRSRFYMSVSQTTETTTTTTTKTTTTTTETTSSPTNSGMMSNTVAAAVAAAAATADATANPPSGLHRVKNTNMMADDSPPSRSPDQTIVKTSSYGNLNALAGGGCGRNSGSRCNSGAATPLTTNPYSHHNVPAAAARALWQQQQQQQQQQQPQRRRHRSGAGVGTASTRTILVAVMLGAGLMALYSEVSYVLDVNKHDNSHPVEPHMDMPMAAQTEKNVERKLQQQTAAVAKEVSTEASIAPEKGTAEGEEQAEDAKEGAEQETETEEAEQEKETEEAASPATVNTFTLGNNTRVETRVARLILPGNQPDESRGRPGAIILGMHRSGTSMLSGLLHESLGYDVGGPLVGASYLNEKGYYEHEHVVVQNDVLLANQGMKFDNIDAVYSEFDIYKAVRRSKRTYQSEIANPVQPGERLEMGRNMDFTHGKLALESFLNNETLGTWPYILKDPRLCITLPVWLAHIRYKPAIVVTFRHPIEVALSLKRRAKRTRVPYAFRMWSVYNELAIRYSKESCRVVTTNSALLEDPEGESRRIALELTDKCGLPMPPGLLQGNGGEFKWKKLKDKDETTPGSSSAASSFVDASLQNKKRAKRRGGRKGGRNNEDNKAQQDAAPLADFGNDCVAHSLEGTELMPPATDANSRLRLMIRDRYLKAMQLYCDMQSGVAFEHTYDGFPKFEHSFRKVKRGSA